MDKNKVSKDEQKDTELSFTEILILDMLLLDNEALNHIYEQVSNDKLEYVLSPYCNETVTKEMIRNAILSLKAKGAVSISGDEEELQKPIDLFKEWVCWVHITETGKTLYQKNDEKFFKEYL
jgi:hypothetical protein